MYSVEEKDLESLDLTYERFREWVLARIDQGEFEYTYWGCSCSALNFILDRECYWCKKPRPENYECRIEEFLERFLFACSGHSH